MFMVDDMLFYDHVNVQDIMDQFLKQTNVFSTHLKLYPGIVYSHTNNKMIKMPEDFLKIPLNNDQTQDDEYTLKYKRE